MSGRNYPRDFWQDNLVRKAVLHICRLVEVPNPCQPLVKHFVHLRGILVPYTQLHNLGLERVIESVSE